MEYGGRARGEYARILSALATATFASDGRDMRSATAATATTAAAAAARAAKRPRLAPAAAEEPPIESPGIIVPSQMYYISSDEDEDTVFQTAPRNGLHYITCRCPACRRRDEEAEEEKDEDEEADGETVDGADDEDVSEDADVEGGDEGEDADVEDEDEGEDKDPDDDDGDEGGSPAPAAGYAAAGLHHFAATAHALLGLGGSYIMRVTALMWVTAVGLRSVPWGRVGDDKGSERRTKVPWRVSVDCGVASCVPGL